MGGVAVVGALACAAVTLGNHPTQRPQTEAGAAADSRPVVTHWLGPTFDGMPMSGRQGRSVFYGDCDAGPGADTGCTLPVEVQSWSICRRHPLEIDVIPSRIRRLRGVPVISYGERVEVLTGTTDAVVFANDPAVLPRAIEALRPLDEPEQATSPLPRARLPRWVLRELKLITTLRDRGMSLTDMRSRLGISRSAIRSRLHLAEEVGRSALRRVRPSRFTPGQVIEDRQAWLSRREGLLDPHDREMRRRANRHAARIKTC